MNVGEQVRALPDLLLPKLASYLTSHLSSVRFSPPWRQASALKELELPSTQAAPALATVIRSGAGHGGAISLLEGPNQKLWKVSLS